ncbi:MAG TPA: hypothetical protein VN154_09240, partial [Rhizomicrobium sp.]|nr:hypothetical protein [Rhizomicrobium sp.]
GTTQPASAPAAATKLLPPATAPGTTPVQSAPAKPAVAGPTVNSSAPTLLNPPTKAATPPQAVAAPPPQAAPGTTVPAQPSQRIIGINDSFYPATLIALGILLLIGLYFSFSSRSARTRRSDALGDNPYPKTPLKIGKVVIPAPPKPAAKAPPPRTPAAAVVAGVEQIPLVRNIYAQTASVLWIFATIVVNVIALASLLQQFGFARENWHQPFVWLGSLYSGYATQAFNLTATSVNQQFGLKLPSLLLPIFVLYVSSASAFVVASSGLMRRNTSGESLFAAVIHAGWIFAVPAFVLDAIRYRVVTTFARQNTVLFFGYIAALGIAYIAARFINDDILPGFLQQYGAAAASAVSKGAAAATVLTNELRQ